ncbi:hypothetical protein NECAME_03224 [Necator americanus]|uniref:Uncharacterized protein n=1 Tax=Necator americanus TaxID=51031 RepID=W2T623_NECAM|nr:hypothetical protein NECAME_03224 [Necator americanus]ETN77323.1 hypothetical protein NECAME_03224 [Necator americanus]
MAFITPVVKKDFHLYSMKKCEKDSQKNQQPDTTPKIAEDNDGEWETSLERKLRLELIRERRQRHLNKEPRRRHMLRKISEISNEAVDDVELIEEHEEKNSPAGDYGSKLAETSNKTKSDSDVRKPRKYGAMLRMLKWMSSHSLRGK